MTPFIWRTDSAATGCALKWRTAAGRSSSERAIPRERIAFIFYTTKPGAKRDPSHQPTEGPRLVVVLVKPRVDDLTEQSGDTHPSLTALEGLQGTSNLGDVNTRDVNTPK